MDDVKSLYLHMLKFKIRIIGYEAEWFDLRGYKHTCYIHELFYNKFFIKYLNRDRQ